MERSESRRKEVERLDEESRRDKEKRRQDEKLKILEQQQLKKSKKSKKKKKKKVSFFLDTFTTLHKYYDIDVIHLHIFFSSFLEKVINLHCFEQKIVTLLYQNQECIVLK